VSRNEELVCISCAKFYNNHVSELLTFRKTMMNSSKFSRFGLLAFAILLLSSCASSTSTPSDSSGGNAGLGSTATDNQPSEPEDFNWTVYVQDTSTINVGPMQMDISIDLKAVNTSGKIDGTYTGSATTKAVSHMEGGKGSINAPVEGTSTALSFNINPYVADEDKLAPLAPSEPDDGKLAPLVPSDDDKLAPLNDPNNQPEYEGTGSMTLQSGGYGTVTAHGASVTKGIRMNTSENPLHLTITGTQVRLEVQIPEIGAVYFDGYIRGEGKK
jgi:hypothetical protein